MKRVKENLNTDLKNQMAKEISNTGILNQGTDATMTANSFINSVPTSTNENKKQDMIKRNIKTGNTDKVVSKTKLKTPTGKGKVSLPIMGEKKVESKEATGSGGSGSFEGLFSVEPKKLDMFKSEQPKKQVKGGFVKEGESEVEEKWSKKYKDSIDCNNPKGFSQKAHCQGKVKKVEATEATGSASSGQYSTNSIWAKSTNKKDWAPSRKTQIPGGSFVQVKKKCKKFPYCNQGDINALKMFENETVKKVINDISKKHNISENVIKTILSYEYEIYKSTK